jgi:ABC-type Mn2+/Zn2+ transport systems, permease components
MHEILSFLGALPFECMQAQFMQRALAGLLLLAPLVAIMGVQVVNFRMAFFSDAISHSAFAGVALGLLLAVSPHWSMPLFGILVGLGIVAVRRHSLLSADTVIGVFFAGVMAFGLAIISRDPATARNVQTFLYGDILTITEMHIRLLAVLFVGIVLFQLAGYNRLLSISLNAVLASAHRVRVAFWNYAFAALLALVVMFSVQAVGVFLVTAMLIVPAATARNLARSAQGMLWWAVGVSLFSTCCGLIISAQDWARTATGATIILVACLCFLLSLAAMFRRGRS